MPVALSFRIYIDDLELKAQSDCRFIGASKASKARCRAAILALGDYFVFTGARGTKPGSKRMRHAKHSLVTENPSEPLEIVHRALLFGRAKGVGGESGSASGELGAHEFCGLCRKTQSPKEWWPPYVPMHSMEEDPEGKTRWAKK